MEGLMFMDGMNGVKSNMDFSDALQWIEFGEVVGIKLNGKTRVYFKEEDSIMCKVNNTIYKVEAFYIDAIMSHKWVLFENTLPMVHDLIFEIDEAI